MWLVSLLFAGFIAAAPLDPAYAHPGLRRFALVYATIFRALIPPLFYALFAVFPARSPIDQRIPSLKTGLIAAALIVALPIAVSVGVAGTWDPLTRWDDLPAAGLAWMAASLFALVAFAAGVASLSGPSPPGCWSAWRSGSRSPGARRGSIAASPPVSDGNIEVTRGPRLPVRTARHASAYRVLDAGTLQRTRQADGNFGRILWQRHRASAGRRPSTLSTAALPYRRTARRARSSSGDAVGCSRRRAASATRRIMRLLSRISASRSAGVSFASLSK